MAPHYDEGPYTCEIVNQGFDKNDYGISFCITVQPDMGDQPRTVYLSLLDASGEKAKYWDKALEVLVYLGVSVDPFDLSKLDPENPGCQNLAGIEVSCYCKHKAKDDGSTAERWYVNVPRANYQRTPPEKSDFRKLNALFGKEAKRIASEQQAEKSAAESDDGKPAEKPVDAKPAAKGDEPAEVAAGDDDIPF